MEERKKSLESCFQSCSFAAVPAAKRIDAAESNDGSDPLSGASHSVTSFFVDSSGRSSFILPLKMTFATNNDLEELLATKCFDQSFRNLASGVNPVKDDNNEEVEGEKIGVGKDQSEINASFSFEVKSFPIDKDESNQVTIEGFSILSCYVENLVVNFKTEMTVRAGLLESPPNADRRSTDPRVPISPSFTSSPRHNNNINNFTTDGTEIELKLKEQQQREQVNVLTRLEITPVLTIESRTIRHGGDNDSDIKENTENDFGPDLMLLELAAIPDQMQYNKNNEGAPSILNGTNDGVQEARLSSVSIDVKLTNAFIISVKNLMEINSRTGNNLVSLTIRHSKTHNLPVTITNIALHPGHSRHNTVVAHKTTKTNKTKSEPPNVQQTVCKYNRINQLSITSFTTNHLIVY